MQMYFWHTGKIFKEKWKTQSLEEICHVHWQTFKSYWLNENNNKKYLENLVTKEGEV